MIVVKLTAENIETLQPLAAASYSSLEEATEAAINDWCETVGKARIEILRERGLLQIDS